MAPTSLASIHPAINWENTHERNGCHTLLISDYSSTSKYLHARECNVALEQYRSLIFSTELITLLQIGVRSGIQTKNKEND